MGDVVSGLPWEDVTNKEREWGQADLEIKSPLLCMVLVVQAIE